MVWAQKPGEVGSTGGWVARSGRGSVRQVKAPPSTPGQGRAVAHLLLRRAAADWQYLKEAGLSPL